MSTISNSPLTARLQDFAWYEKIAGKYSNPDYLAKKCKTHPEKTNLRLHDLLSANMPDNDKWHDLQINLAVSAAKCCFNASYLSQDHALSLIPLLENAISAHRTNLVQILFQCQFPHTPENIRKLVEDAPDTLLEILQKSPERFSNKNLHIMFYEACIQGKKELVDELIPKIKNFGNVENSSAPLLVTTIKKGHPDIALQLIFSGMPFTADQERNTPLHIAAKCGNLALVHWLLKYGAQPGLKNVQNYTPLQLASQFGRRDVYEFLMKSSSEKISLLLDSISAGSLSYVAKELEISQKRSLLSDPYFRNRIHTLACECGTEQILLYLMEQGLHVQTSEQKENLLVNIVSRGFDKALKQILQMYDKQEILEILNRTSCLHLAIDRKHLEISRLLIAFGVQLNSTNDVRQSPLSGAHCKNAMCYLLGLAEKLGSQRHTDSYDESLFGACGELMLMLIEHGAMLNGRDKFHRTVLQRALDAGFPLNILKCIIGKLPQNLSQFSLIELHPQKGYFPINQVLADYRPEEALPIVYYLMEKGANPTQIDRAGENALNIAILHDHDELTMKFLSMGISPNCIHQSSKKTLLHSLIEKKRIELLSSLLENKAVLTLIDAKDCNGKTALNIACEMEKKNAAMLLLQKGASLSDCRFPSEWYQDQKFYTLLFPKLEDYLTQSKISPHEDLSLLFNQPAVSDCLLTVSCDQEKKSFHVRKDILKARSPYFNHLFSAEQTTYFINSIDIEAFEAVLLHLYGKEFPISHSNFRRLAPIAIQLDQGLVQRLQRWESEHPECKWKDYLDLKSQKIPKKQKAQNEHIGAPSKKKLHI